MLKKQEIKKAYIQLLKDKLVPPKRSDLINCGFSLDLIRYHFGNFSNLKDIIKSEYPDLHFTYIQAQVEPKKIQKEISRYQKFVVTTVVVGTPVHKQFYYNLKFYCKTNKAKLLILLSYPKNQDLDLEIDPILKNETIINSEYHLNENLGISDFKMNSTQINPLTGFNRLGRRERSLIIASPKQFLQYVPIANDQMCHAIMTTGAMTMPVYSSFIQSPKTAYISTLDHKLGAIVVEIENAKEFHIRQLQAEIATGFFIDLARYYKTKIIESVRPEAIVLGDKHTGHTDPTVLRVTDRLIKDMSPKRVFFHDLFDGQSINPHSAQSNILRAGMSTNQLSLEAELKLCTDEMNRMVKEHPKVNEWVVVRSNHDEFLDRYLESGEYIADPLNSFISHKLAIEKLQQNNPLETGMRMFNLKGNVKFLNIYSSYKIAGIEHGVHGHIGLNGQKSPTNSSLEIGYGPGVYGHSHSPGILRDVFRVGTSTVMRLGYNVGASSWFHTHCITYHNGSRQLINIINGKYKKK